MIDRRKVAAGVFALGALGAGFGAAVWRSRSPAPPDLRGFRFERPEGGEFTFESIAGKPLLLNFWAPWCVPCVVEMPLLDRFYSEHHANGWEVLCLAIDQKPAVDRFMAERSLHLPIALGGADGLALSTQLGNHAGGLPFSVLFRADGSIRERKLGALDAPLLTRWSSAST